MPLCQPPAHLPCHVPHLGLCCLCCFRAVVPLCLQHRRRLSQLGSKRLLLPSIMRCRILVQARRLQQALGAGMRSNLPLQRRLGLRRRRPSPRQLLLCHLGTRSSRSGLCSGACQRLCELCSIHHGPVVLLLGLRGGCLGCSSRGRGAVTLSLERRP